MIYKKPLIMILEKVLLVRTSFLVAFDLRKRQKGCMLLSWVCSLLFLLFTVSANQGFGSLDDGINNFCWFESQPLQGRLGDYRDYFNTPGYATITSLFTALTPVGFTNNRQISTISYKRRILYNISMPMRNSLVFDMPFFNC